jgi:UDP-N-acetylmuramate--alanine ligase
LQLVNNFQFMKKIRVGILFGGSSREREVSFAGGRTVYDNLSKSIFEAVPIFIDSQHRFILLDWQYIYKGTIRDFYPPVFAIQNKSFDFQYYIENLGKLSDEEYKKIIQAVGKKLEVEHLSNYIDFAFLCLHGSNGEDGRIQGLLEFLKIPYSGSGIFPSAFGMNKALQKEMMSAFQFNVPKFISITRSEWENMDIDSLYQKIKTQVGFPLVVKPANQGSSIGVSSLKTDDKKALEQALRKAFFVYRMNREEWQKMSESEKTQWAKTFSDIRENIGLPALINQDIIYDPAELISYLDNYLLQHSYADIESMDTENEVIVEEFIDGKEFSCIVIEDEQGRPIALPPTEIIKKDVVFDYKSKYLPGLSRKVTPIDLPEHQIQAIREEAERMYKVFHFDVYARIDGFITKEGKIFLNDPNTTSGMMPSSFFFHQAAEIGLNPSEFLTYIIFISLKKRQQQSLRLNAYQDIILKLNNYLKEKQTTASQKKLRTAVLMGGYSTERHISVESGRNVYEKLSSSEKYQPFPVFVTKANNDAGFELYTIPIRLMLKDNADDIRDKILHYQVHPIIQKIIQEASYITEKFGQTKNLNAPKKIGFEELKSMADVVFIALHGRPGEDGSLQRYLNEYQIPYNGSDVQSSSITINKYLTNEILKKHGILVAEHLLITKEDWEKFQHHLKTIIRDEIHYPLIAKPSDDGCSSAVKKIKNEQELDAYAQLIFREKEELPTEAARLLNIKPNEEIPMKKDFLIEELIQSNGAKRFLEITGGMLIKYNDKGEKEYEVFEPSEALVEGDVLSLEEKFLAGEGQNITPARFSKNPEEQKKISNYVKEQLRKTAEILNVEGYCRIDAFVRIYDADKVEVIIIEVNSLPGMTPATCIYHQAAINNYKPYEFIDAILTQGMKKKKLSSV